MNYLSLRESKTLSNEPYDITEDDLKEMLRQNERDKEECKRITEMRYRGESGNMITNNSKHDYFLEFCNSVVQDMKTEGYLMEYPHGICITQGEHSSYYRGENDVFFERVPNLQRKLNCLSLNGFSHEDYKVYRFVEEMRVHEFQLLLQKIDLVKKWEAEYGTVLYEPLAQHYGLETFWLDITSDFEVALFFANCDWDNKKKMWKPLTQEQINHRPYGMIFHIPSDCAKFATMFEYGAGRNLKNLHNGILPIGYQPFMRCHFQHAYAIHMEQPRPLQKDVNFEKLRFKHSVELSQWIYKKMKGGRAIYPHEGLKDLDDVIEKIKNATEFSEKTFQYVFSKSMDFKDPEECRALLYKSNLFDRPISIAVNQHPYTLSRQRLRALNRKYKDFTLEKDYGIKLNARPVFYGKSI